MADASQDRLPDRAREGRGLAHVATRGLAAYLQIEEELASRIEGGVLAVGDQIPAERQLASQMGVSRMTVRQALARLEHRGLVSREHGRGTFVSEPKLRHQATALRGFFQESVGQGVLPVTRTVERGRVYATRGLATTLGLSPGEEIYKVVRLRFARGVATVVETSFFPASRFPGLLEMDLDHGSIYRLMDRHFHARPVRGVQAMESVAAERPEAELLGVPVGSPLMLLERTAWDEGGHAVEHARDLYRGDRSRFLAELTL
jgi:GntR family transcriptional regulator